MASKPKVPKEGHFVVAIFHDADAFVSALDGLISGGFDRAAISVLADHTAIKDHFGRIPDPETMAERPDTPREDLDTEGALHAAIRFIAETVAVVGEFGAAGVAYAVGGPVGIASGTATAADLSINDVMSRYVDRSYHDRFAQSVTDGGAICWVHAASRGEVDRAQKILETKGGADVHEVDL